MAICEWPLPYDASLADTLNFHLEKAPKRVPQWAEFRELSWGNTGISAIEAQQLGHERAVQLYGEARPPAQLRLVYQSAQRSQRRLHEIP